MNLIKLTLTTFLMTLLIACGGGSPDKETETPSLGDEPAAGGGTTGGGTTGGGTTGGDDGTGGTNLIENIRFGSGSGTDFKNKSINFENGYSLLGTTQPITVSVVDPNNNSSIVAQSYTYKFSSVCADETPPKSSFLTDTIVNASGTATVSYTNDNCLADTITVSLINPDGTEKAQIVSSIEVSVPKLGSGSGSGFVEGKISGDVNLPINAASTVLSLDAVDRHISVVNKKISSDDYIVKWTSLCSTSSFSVPKQELTSDIETTYNANDCTTDTVTASLYTEKDLTTAIDTANVAISIGSEAAIVETPVLGAGIGANFKAGELTLGAEYVLVGSRLDFTVNTVDTDASKALTKNNYQYKFESSCAANASFESEVVASSTGQVANTYLNHNCAGANTLTVSLFAADADVNADPALDTINVVVDAVEPKLGSGTGAAFLAGKITGEVNLVDTTSTLLSLNVIDPSITAVNSAISSSDYVVKWTSSCAGSSFSVPEQTLTTGIQTRYDANACAPTDTVTASLYSRKDLATAIDTANVAISIGSEAAIVETPVLGAGIGANFKAGELTLGAEYVLVGSRLDFTVNSVATDASNALTKNNYQYKFESSCAANASFESEVVASSTGQVANTYLNHNCAGANTLTVSLFAADADVNADPALDTINVVIDAVEPKLGSGTGAAFVAGKISGEVNLIDETSTLLNLNVIDPSITAVNSAINSSDYVVKWTSSCATSSFSVPEQTLTTGIETRYDANACTPADNITASLYSRKDLTTAIDTANVAISIGSEAVIVETPKLGNGIGANFKAGELSLGAEYVLVGSRLDFTVNAVDTDASNALTKNNYQYTFESSCAADASFESDVIASSAGQVTNTYFNHNCSGANTLTISLFAADADVNADPALDTISVVVDAVEPKLGSGTGAAFVAGKISGEVNLVDETSTLLSLDVIDPSITAVNSAINSSDYVVKWTSSCAASSFSVPEQTLTTGIETRYDANTCAPTDTVTASLYSRKDLANAIDTASVDISISEILAENPVLGTGNSSTFDAEKLSLSADYALAGSSVIITVNGVDANNNNALLDTKYLYKFESTCPSNTVNFSSNVIANNNGLVVNTYFNRTCDTDDEITVSLFSANADVSVELPLATATAQIKTDLPKLGNKSGSGFISGELEGNLNLVDDASTVLKATAVDPLDSNAVLNSSDYYIKWTSDCPTADFSIVTNNLSSAIETRYDGDAQACITDTVTLTLFNKFDEALDSITGDITISESLVPADPALGTGVEAGFIVGELQFTETDIAARQTIGVSVNIVDVTGSANTLITDTEYAVVFSSACVTGGDASFDNTQVRTTSGSATTFYTASGCKETDTINAALYAVEDNVVNTTTSLAIAKGNINIELPESNSIEYQSMTARKIAMQNISFAELPESTTVSFMVKDEFDQPISGKQVAFSLSNKSVDASLSGGTLGDIQGEGEVLASTNADGVVTITVKSGKTHGLVTVLAVAEKNDGTLLRTQSFGISITTGIPVQTSFSLVLDTLNPRGWDFFGDTVSATVFLADRFHNPVPDGTIVNFLADGGSIQPTCETSNGTCSVEWRAQNPRPGFSKDNSPMAKQQTKLATEHPTNDPSSQFFGTGPGVEVDSNWDGGRSGLVTILAYLEGEVDYADANGNGRFDEGEDYTPMAEAYLDANEDGVYTEPKENNPFEQLIEYVANGIRDPAPAYYQGSTCTQATRDLGLDHCSSLVHIRREARLVMASDNVGFKIDSIVGGKTADLSSASCINVFNEEFVTFNFSVSDYNGNTPINGTALTLDAEGFEVDVQPDAIANSALTESVIVPVTIRRDDTFEDKKGLVRLSAAHPDGGIAGFIESVPVTDDPRIRINTTNYVIDITDIPGDPTATPPVAPTPNPQSVTFTFVDACGIPPSDNDIIIFEVVNMSQSSNAGTADRFQIYGSDLTASGDYDLTLSSPVSGSGDGEIIIRAVNVAAGGLETTSTFSVTVE